jgi:hypothetical protein
MESGRPRTRAPAVQLPDCDNPGVLAGLWTQARLRLPTTLGLLARDNFRLASSTHNRVQAPSEASNFPQADFGARRSTLKSFPE